MSVPKGQVGLLVGLLGAGCTTEPPPPPPPRPPAVVVPPAELGLHIGRIPLVVDLPRAVAATEVSATLDGVPLRVDAPLVRGERGRTTLLAELDFTEVPDGDHTLVLSAGPHTLAHAVRVERPACALSVVVRDHSGSPIDARVSVSSEGSPVPLLAEAAPAADRSRREAALDSVFTSASGAPTALWLPPGTYTLSAARGLRSGVASTRVVCPEHPVEQTIELVTSPGLPLDGMVLADLHVHTAASVDTWIPDARRLRSLAASGLDFAVLSDHHVVRAALASTAPRLVTGVEHTHQPGKVAVAHINAFPLSPGTALPSQEGRSLASTLGALRKLPGVALVQLDHPRGVDLRHDPNRAPVRPLPYRPGTTLLDRSLGYAVWSHPGLDRGQPLDAEPNAWMLEVDPGTGATALSFDVVEVFNRSSLARYREVRADWFALLNQGVWRPATGNSDSHAATVELPGMPANVVMLPPGEADVERLAGALKTGRHAVSNGPVPHLTVRTVNGATVELGGLASVAGSVDVTVSVQAASWVPVAELRLVRDGEVIERISLELGGDPSGPPVQWTRTLRVEVPADGWILAEVGWPLDAPVAAVDALPLAWTHAAPGHVPLGFTNPIRLDADGDGLWRPPGALSPDRLNALQQSR